VAQSAILIYNPRAGRWRTAQTVRSLVEILTAAGWHIEAHATEHPGHATSLARRAVRQGSEYVLAFGGDGTLRETAAGLMGSGAALGMIPGGTANVLTLSLGLPSDPLTAARSLGRPTVVEMDVGICKGEPFLMLASAGLDACVLTRVQPRFKRFLGRAAFGLTTLHQWWSYPYPEIDLLADGRPQRATFAAVCNVPHYGGRWRLAPEASFTDGLLDLVLFRGRGRAATLGFARDLAAGRHSRRPDVTLLKVREVAIHGPRHLALQIDGDALPAGPPATIRLAAERLRVLLPD
jgi:YegS/Rv2252/BmrU family lipid kinase